MKKIILLAVLFSAISFNSFAQSPEGFKYQAVVRDASQNVIPNQAIGMQISILQGSASGTVVYQETFTPTSNTYGLVNLEIGTGSVVSGTFSSIDWSAGPYFIETAMDATGGTSYTVMGTSQLLSVPYALYAKSAESITNDMVNDADSVVGNEYNTSVVLNGTMLETTDGGGTITTDLSSLQDGVNDADADSTNELQVLSLNNDTLFLSDGGFADLSNYALDNVIDADSDSTNELQALSISGDTVSLENGGSIVLPLSVDTAQSIILMNGWNDPLNNAKFYVDRGRVYLSGLLQGGSALDIGILPIGFRPSKDVYYFCPSNFGGVNIRVQMNGMISFYSLTTGIPGWTSLDGVSFRL